MLTPLNEDLPAEKMPTIRHRPCALLGNGECPLVTRQHNVVAVRGPRPFLAKTSQPFLVASSKADALPFNGIPICVCVAIQKKGGQ